MNIDSEKGTSKTDGTIMTSIPISSDEEFPKIPFVYSFIEPIGYTLLFTASLVISFLINPSPRERPIPYQLINSNGFNATYVINLSNNEESLGDTVSNFALMIIGIAPLLLQLLLSKFWGFRNDVHGTICTYIVSLSLNSFTTELIKNYVGYLRPEFYDVCEPSVDYQTCIADGPHAVDARKSFPSGHASISMCSLLLLTLYVNSRFGFPEYHRQLLLKKQQLQQQHYREEKILAYHPAVYRFISILSLIPTALALFVAVSRVRDNRHFPADVVGGSVLGASIAMFVNNLWLVPS